MALAAVGDAVEAESESCLDIFFGYVRRGIANEVLRAVRRCPNLCWPILTYAHLCSTSIANEVLRTVRRCPNLSLLILTYSPPISPNLSCATD